MDTFSLSRVSEVYILQWDWWLTWKQYVRYDWYAENGGPEVQLSRNMSYTQSARPTDVENGFILESGGQLRKELRENFDFIILPQEAWELLTKWYQGGPEIKRQTIQAANEQQPHVDLYPWMVLLQLKGETGRPKPDANWSLSIPGNKPTVNDFFAHIQLETKLTDIKCLWYKEGSKWVKMDTTTHISLANGTILIDTIGGDPPSGDQNWETLQVGDKVDVQRAPGYWVSCCIVNKAESYIIVHIEKERKQERLAQNSPDLSLAGSKPQ